MTDKYDFSKMFVNAEIKPIPNLQAELLPCPFCGGRATATLEAMGGEWVGLILRGHGKIYPEVCLNCGLVYISKNDCERINKARKDKFKERGEEN